MRGYLSLTSKVSQAKSDRDWVLSNRQRYIKLMLKRLYVQEGLTHGTLVDVHLPVQPSERTVVPGADKSSIFLLAPELKTLILLNRNKKLF